MELREKTTHEQDLFITIILKNWLLQVKRGKVLLDGISEDEIMKEVAPGKNRGIYIVGHIIAYHDLMGEILGYGKRKYPQLQPIFIEAADKSGLEMPGYAELKALYEDVHKHIAEQLEVLPTEQWYQRHEAMTDEDFKKDPTRNKLNVLVSRISHLAYHLGQLRLLK
ncbi:DinB family protein [Epilithonimonas hungarica]|uniref:DinB superfamily protein n=1 Tax=Epilithonimonas hungarica TaxID=454006 RepID=A0A1G7S549_9FLAO|nr:DinB family protein [Epilithonimonas hungarica]SDG18111.1 DinB superfamily protein [Epilithonimonas hungarica]